MTETARTPNSLVVPAQADDVTSLLAIMDQANQYELSQSGEPIWTTRHAEDGLRALIESGACHVIRYPG
jgi:hypothetical protein